DGQGVALGVTNAEGRIVVERSQEWWGTVRPMHRDFVFQPANVLVQGIAKDGTVLAFEARPAESAIPAFAVRFVDKRFKVYRGAASHDDGSLRVEFDFHCPRLLGLVVDHVFPVFFRYQVLKIGGTAVRPPVEDPEDSAVFFFGTRLERNGYTDPS
ncbi:MAG: hypothetical protein GY903_00710, partial [Fuerstiella sp.]|nr:hypothetical protein [Fuerstiella sp.]